MEEEKAIRTEKKKREKVLLPATLDRQRKPTAGCRRKKKALEGLKALRILYAAGLKKGQANKSTGRMPWH